MQKNEHINAPARNVDYSSTRSKSMENRAGRIFDDPRKLTYQLVKKITNDFTHELGRGAFGRVFKGLLEDGEVVAVKVLHYFTPEISDQQFQNEFENLKRLKHPNIVQLVGFCDETEDEIVEHKGKLVVCERIRRALSLEYVPNGSLGKLLSGEYLGNNWPIRYKIIKGICNGLKYLREGLEVPIFHFDLKPDNILLDEKMEPKIADFGLSRLIGEENTRKTMSPLGTVGYLPPEFITNQVISQEYDIFSLGVIVAQIIAGITGYFEIADMGTQEFIDHESAADCANLFATLSAMPFLSSLLISARDVNETLCLQALALKFPKLHRLVVRRRWADETLEYPIFRDHGKHLKYLALSWCQLGEDPFGVLAPHVPNLTYLSFNRVNSASTLVLSAGCFPNLKTLVLKKMPNVEQLEIGHGALPCIQGLYIMSLAQLDKVPQGIESLLSLKKLWLLYLHAEFRTQWLTNGMHQKMQHVPEIRV